MLRRGLPILWGCLLLAGLAPAPARDISLSLLYVANTQGRLAGGPAPGLLDWYPAFRAAQGATGAVVTLATGNVWAGAPEADLSDGRLVHGALKLMGCDAWVPGLDDWSRGLIGLESMAHDAPPASLAANVVDPDGRRPLGGTWIKDIGGARLMVVAMCPPQVPLAYPETMWPGVEFQDAGTALKMLLPEIRQAKPDILVLITPDRDPATGLPAAALLRQFPVFQVVIATDAEQRQPGVMVGPTLLAQVPAGEPCAGRLDLVFDTISRTCRDLHGRALPAATNAPAGAAADLLQQLGPEWDQVRREADEVVGVVSPDMAANPGLVLAAAMTAATGAELAMYQDPGVSLAPGPITRGALWRLVPQTGDMGTLMLTQAEVREILADPGATPMPGRGLKVYGLDAAARPAAADDDDAAGDPANGRKRWKMAVPARLLASDGGRFPALRRAAALPNARLVMTGLNLRDALEMHLQVQALLHGDLPVK